MTRPPTNPHTCAAAVTLYLGACVEPPCLVMEFCAKRSLDTLLSAGVMDPKARPTYSCSCRRICGCGCLLLPNACQCFDRASQCQPADRSR